MKKIVVMLILLTQSIAFAGWSSMSSGTSSNLNAVWGTADNNVYAVGSGGVILHYNGSAWSSMTSGTSDDLQGIWGTSNSDIFAVGYFGVILHYNGSTWSSMDGEESVLYTEVWGSSSNNVFAVGTGEKISRYNGSAWSSMHAGSKTLNGVWGSSGNDVFAVGSLGIILHYNGSSCSTMVSGTTQNFQSVWGTASNNVFAIAANGIIQHYDGSSWSSMTSGTSSHLYGIWGSAGNDVFCVGHSGTIRHYNGTEWSYMFGGTSNHLYGIWGSSNGNVFVVGASGKILHYVPLSAPETQASNINFTNVGITQFTVNWTNGDGSKRAVFIKQASSGTQIGSTGWYCVYNGTGTNVTVTGLEAGTTYRAMVCEYNGSAGSELYLTETATNNPNNQTSLESPTVTTQAASSISTTTATGNGNVTDLGVPNPTQHGVCWSTSENPTTADSKTEEGAASATGAFTSSITGLTPGTLYYVRAYATNSASTSYGSQVSFYTISTTPTTQASNLIWQSATRSSIGLHWTNGNGDGRIVICKQQSSISSSPLTNGTDYDADASYTGSGSSVDGGKIVYKGTGNSVTVTNLTRNRIYNFKVFEYNGSGQTIAYNQDNASGNPNSRMTLRKESIFDEQEQPGGNVHQKSNIFEIFKISPNPAQDRLNIEFSNNLPNEINISIFTIDGKLVSKLDNYKLSGNVADLNLKDFCSGEYNLIILCDNELVYGSFVIQR